jgi:hypothetical protein
MQAKHSTNRLRELRQNVKILTNLHVWDLASENYQNISHYWRSKFFVWHQHKKKHQFFCSSYTGRSSILFTSAVITGVQMGEMSKSGWLIMWSNRYMWAVSLYFLHAVSGSGKCRDRNEAPDLKTGNMIMCCLLSAASHLLDEVTNECRTIVDWWWVRKKLLQRRFVHH